MEYKENMVIKYDIAMFFLVISTSFLKEIPHGIYFRTVY